MFALVATLAGLTQRASATTIRADGLLEINGDVLFPLGLWDIGIREYDDWNDRIRRSGVNCVWDHHYVYDDMYPRCDAVVDSARAAGYYLLVGSPNSVRLDNLSTPDLEVEAPIYEALRTWSLLRCLDASPGVLLGLANRDEPVWTQANGWIGNIDTQHILDTYMQLHSAAEVPVVLNLAPLHVSGDFISWRNDLLPFLDATDVVAHASYPYPPGAGTCLPRNVLGHPECSMDRLADNVDLFLSEVNHPGQPLWIIVQAFKSIPQREARWEAYASIVHGATGVIWAGWTWTHPLGDGSANWPVIAQVTREVSRLHPFLIGPDVPGVASTEPNVDVRAKRHATDNCIIVLAVGRRDFRGTARIRLPAARDGRVEVIGEDRTLVAVEGWIDDEFQGYEAHVYRYAGREPTTELAPERFTLSALSNRPSRGAVARLAVPERGTIIVTVHEAKGRRIALAGVGIFEPGTSEITWDGRSSDGAHVPSGVYFLRARTAAGDEATARISIVD